MNYHRYRLSKVKDAEAGNQWAVLDEQGKQYGIQPDRNQAKQLLHIVRHMELARIGGGLNSQL